MARIRAVIRRHDVSTQLLQSNDQTISFDNFTLHSSTRELHRPNDIIHLTGCENDFLHALLTHPNQPLSRERLMNIARGKEHDVFDRTIDVQISRLRKLVEDNPKQPKLIQTVWGVGYMFVPPDKLL
jgi:DNA-binding response OmpR family regulator